MDTWHLCGFMLEGRVLRTKTRIFPAAAGQGTMVTMRKVLMIRRLLLWPIHDAPLAPSPATGSRGVKRIFRSHAIGRTSARSKLRG